MDDWALILVMLGLGVAAGSVTTLFLIALVRPRRSSIRKIFDDEEEPPR